MSELVVISNIRAIDVFVDRGLDPYIEQIEKEARSVAVDISTEKGRKEVASLAYKIAQSKVALDELGKGLTEDWKQKSKVVDAERKRVRDRLDALRDEIRMPLTNWEEKDKTRIAQHEADIAEFTEVGRVMLEKWQSLPLDAMQDRLKEIEADGRKEWEEFAARGQHAVETAIASVKAAIQRREKHDFEQAELIRLRKAEEERKQKEREERIASEAAAKAKAEAEAVAKRNDEAAEALRQALVREKEEAEHRAKQAEEDRKIAVEKAERDRIAAAEQSKKDAEAAANAERERIEAECKAEAEAAAKREADRKHRTKINNEALAGFTSAGLSEESAKKAVEAVAKGRIPHIKIAY